MSATAEQVSDKPKRKYTKRPVTVEPGVEPNPPVEGRPARKVEQTESEAEFRCTIALDTYFEISASGDRLKKHHTCTNEAKHVPMVTFYGKRKEEEPPGSKNYVIRTYPFKVRFGHGAGVCDEHRKLIEQDVRVLVSAQELENQSGNMQTIGLPKPSPKLTKVTFLPFTPPKPDVESEHMNSLMGLGGEDETDEEIETL